MDFHRNRRSRANELSDTVKLFASFGTYIRKFYGSRYYGKAMNIVHHPAMAVPCGFSDGLPVLLMLIGKHFDEPAIYKAAFAFEQSGDWKKMQGYRTLTTAYCE